MCKRYHGRQTSGKMRSKRSTQWRKIMKVAFDRKIECMTRESVTLDDTICNLYATTGTG